MMNNNLFDDHVYLVYKIVNKMDYGYVDKEDLLQAGLIYSDLTSNHNNQMEHHTIPMYHLFFYEMPSFDKSLQHTAILSAIPRKYF